MELVKYYLLCDSLGDSIHASSCGFALVPKSMLPSSVTVAKLSGFKCVVLDERRGRRLAFSHCLVPIVLLGPGSFDSASSSLHHSASKISWPSVCALLSQGKVASQGRRGFAPLPRGDALRHVTYLNFHM